MEAFLWGRDSPSASGKGNRSLTRLSGDGDVFFKLFQIHSLCLQEALERSHNITAMEERRGSCAPPPPLRCDFYMNVCATEVWMVDVPAAQINNRSKAGGGTDSMLPGNHILAVTHVRVHEQHENPRCTFLTMQSTSGRPPDAANSSHAKTGSLPMCWVFLDEGSKWRTERKSSLGNESLKLQNQNLKSNLSFR